MSTRLSCLLFGALLAVNGKWVEDKNGQALEASIQQRREASPAAGGVDAALVQEKEQVSFDQAVALKGKKKKKKKKKKKTAYPTPAPTNPTRYPTKYPTRQEVNLNVGSTIRLKLKSQDLDKYVGFVNTRNGRALDNKDVYKAKMTKYNKNDLHIIKETNWKVEKPSFCRRGIALRSTRHTDYYLAIHLEGKARYWWMWYGQEREQVPPYAGNQIVIQKPYSGTDNQKYFCWIPRADPSGGNDFTLEAAANPGHFFHLNGTFFFLDEEQHNTRFYNDETFSVPTFAPTQKSYTVKKDRCCVGFKRGNKWLAVPGNYGVRAMTSGSYNQLRWEVQSSQLCRGKGYVIKSKLSGRVLSLPWNHAQKRYANNTVTQDRLVSVHSTIDRERMCWEFRYTKLYGNRRGGFLEIEQAHRRGYFIRYNGASFEVTNQFDYGTNNRTYWTSRNFYYVPY